jgi:hypothetical protein
MKKALTISTLVFLISFQLQSQDREEVFFRPIQFFIGIQPAIDIEPFDAHSRNTVDVNVLPLQLEYAVSDKWSIRMAPFAFAQFKPEFPVEISRIGTGFTVPYHFSKKNSEEGHRGFYAGPHAAVTMHRLDDFMSTTFAAEIGYYFLFNSILSFNIGIQAGRTIQIDPNNRFNLIYNHTAGIIAFGFWF